jgi:hypothetical protein
VSGPLGPLLAIAATTVALLVLTEQHAELPAALAACTVAWWLLRGLLLRGLLPRESPKARDG